MPWNKRNRTSAPDVQPEPRADAERSADATPTVDAEKKSQEENAPAAPEVEMIDGELLDGEAEEGAADGGDEIEPLRAEVEEAKDRALRVGAELDNFRKRAARQMEEERRYANIHLIRDLLPVLDNIDRAIEAAEKSDDAAGLLEGFRMVGQMLGDTLQRYHCQPIDPLHDPFDPAWHQAISQMPSEEYEANTVIVVTQTGFQLHDRVVRPAQVIVSSGPPQPPEEEQNEEEA